MVNNKFIMENIMATQNDWNVELYLKFRNERTQPSIDLVSGISVESPKSIIDIGCGPGNSTQVLAGRWPAAGITGLDNSPSMIEKAKKDYPSQEWILADVMDVDSSVKYDIVFSNATIQWIPDHKQLIDAMWKLVNDNGALAVQMPLYNAMPVCGAVERAASGRWPQLDSVMEIFTFHEPGYYYDVLSFLSEKVNMWVTDYLHIMDSHKSILEMIKSAGLKPYMDRLKSEDDKHEFESEVLRNIKEAYPAQENRRVIFPFKRLFFIAYK